MKTDLLCATIIPLTCHQPDAFQEPLKVFFALHHTYSIQLLS